MIHSKWAAVAAVVMTSAIASAQAPSGGVASTTPAVGVKAPEINAKEWLNNVGGVPNLENLRGQPVLLEFWATWCPPCRASMPHLQEIHEEFADQGLVIVALSDEMKKDVQPFVEKMGLPFIVGAASTSKAAYGIRGIPHTFLVDADGTITWSGHPMELTAATVKKLVHGARLPKNRLLAFRGDVDGTKTQTKYEKLARNGELAAAIEQAEATLVDAKASAEEKGAAEATKKSVSAYVDDIRKRAEGLIESRDVAEGRALYEALAKEFERTDVGASAKKRLDEIAKDASLSREIEAMKELNEVKKQIDDIGIDKAKKRLEALVSKYVGTKASERALLLLK